jgi:serine/threonine protein kinase
MVLYEGNLENLIDESNQPCQYLEPVKKQMLDALAFLAKNSVIHRDIKPDNILHDAAGKKFYLSDFGFTKEQNDTCTPVGAIAYRAPEIFKKIAPTPKADIFSLGLVMLRILNLLPELRSTDHFDRLETYHDQIRSIAQRYREDISPMLSDNPDDRSTALECLHPVFGSDSDERAVLRPIQTNRPLPTRSQTFKRDRSSIPSASGSDPTQFIGGSVPGRKVDPKKPRCGSKQTNSESPQPEPITRKGTSKSSDSQSTPIKQAKPSPFPSRPLEPKATPSPILGAGSEKSTKRTQPEGKKNVRPNKGKSTEQISRPKPGPRKTTVFASQGQLEKGDGKPATKSKPKLRLDVTV